ncbi:uncharacterized protein [Aristolochia californica]|uniref:uncharacterized protein n=1 Tax=Aristolochia californica TaxID=171875 RepID=UPI0035DD9FA0
MRCLDHHGGFHIVTKHNLDSSITHLKARLVANGYTQCYGVNYKETFSLVAKLNSVRFLLSLVANSSWPSPRGWFENFSQTMVHFGFSQYLVDLFVFVKNTLKGRALLRKYVLDLLEDTWMMGCRTVDTPMDANTKLCANFGENVDISKY